MSYFGPFPQPLVSWHFSRTVSLASKQDVDWVLFVGDQQLNLAEAARRKLRLGDDLVVDLSVMVQAYDKVLAEVRQRVPIRWGGGPRAPRRKQVTFSRCC